MIRLSVIKIRAYQGQENGKDLWTTFNVVDTPGVVFDSSTNIYYRIGEFNNLKVYYTQRQLNIKQIINTLEERQKADCLPSRESWINEYKNMLKHLALLELPKDQKLIDKIFNNSGYLDTYIRSKSEDKIT